MRKHKKHLTNRLKALFIVFVSFCVGAILAEAIVRITNVDWRFVKKNLYYQTACVANHMPDPDPSLLFRYRPSTQKSYTDDDFTYRVTINSEGARSPERSFEKQAGVFRIVCLGGSNVFGAKVNDEQTWPARLELALNKNAPKRFEVWNFGTSAYVGSQMASLARKIHKRLQPDLYIFGISNQGAPAFLRGEEFKDYFEREPFFWELLMPAKDFLGPLGPGRPLFATSRLDRLVVLLAASFRTQRDRPLWKNAGEWFEPENSRRLRTLFREKDMNKRCVLFMGPYAPLYANKEDTLEASIAELLQRYGSDLVPTFFLRSQVDDPQLIDIHPPPAILDWYGLELAGWLQQEGLVPTNEAL